MNIKSVFILLLGFVGVIACGSSGSSVGGIASNPNAGGISLHVSYNPVKKAHPKGATSLFNSSESFVPEMMVGNNDPLNAINYNLTDGTDTYTGIGDVSSSDTFLITDVNPASGYTISLNGVSISGLLNCTGTSGAFTVLPKKVTSISVNFFCTGASDDAGAVAVTANTENCDTWNWDTTSMGVNAGTWNIYISINSWNFGNQPFLMPTTSDPLGSVLFTPVTYTPNNNAVTWVAYTSYSCNASGPNTITLAASNPPGEGADCAPYDTTTLIITCP